MRIPVPYRSAADGQTVTLTHDRHPATIAHRSTRKAVSHNSASLSLTGDLRPHSLERVSMGPSRRKGRAGALIKQMTPAFRGRCKIFVVMSEYFTFVCG